MNINLSEIVCILDRSGSMESIRSDAIGGYNTFLEGQKQVPGEARLTLVLFNHEYEVVRRAEALGNATPLAKATYVPTGTTALLDAVGRTVDDVGARLANTPEHERPGKVIVAILTDGLENASKDYTKPRIAAMIKHQQEVYGWEFIFLGANQDAFSEAQALNIPAVNAANFAATSAGVRSAYQTASNLTARYRQGGNSEKEQDKSKPWQ